MSETTVVYDPWAPVYKFSVGLPSETFLLSKRLVTTTVTTYVMHYDTGSQVPEPLPPVPEDEVTVTTEYGVTQEMEDPEGRLYLKTMSELQDQFDAIAKAIDLVLDPGYP